MQGDSVCHAESDDPPSVNQRHHRRTRVFLQKGYSKIFERRKAQSRQKAGNHSKSENNIRLRCASSRERIPASLVDHKQSHTQSEGKYYTAHPGFRLDYAARETAQPSYSRGTEQEEKSPPMKGIGKELHNFSWRFESSKASDRTASREQEHRQCDPSHTNEPGKRLICLKMHAVKKAHNY